MAKRKSSHRAHARKHHSRPIDSVTKSAPVFAAPQPSSLSSESHDGFRKLVMFLVVGALIAVLVYHFWPRGGKNTSAAESSTITPALPVLPGDNPLLLRQKILKFFRQPLNSVGFVAGFVLVVVVVALFIRWRLQKRGSVSPEDFIRTVYASAKTKVGALKETLKQELEVAKSTEEVEEKVDSFIKTFEEACKKLTDREKEVMKEHIGEAENMGKERRAFLTAEQI